MNMLITNNFAVQCRIDSLYPTSLPNYTLKPIDLDFNVNLRQKKISYCKGLGKVPKRSVINHFRCKLKKRNNNLKRKTHSHEISKSF
jgi:hypothetical protein